MHEYREDEVEYIQPQKSLPSQELVVTSERTLPIGFCVGAAGILSPSDRVRELTNSVPVLTFRGELILNDMFIPLPFDTLVQVLTETIEIENRRGFILLNVTTGELCFLPEAFFRLIGPLGRIDKFEFSLNIAEHHPYSSALADLGYDFKSISQDPDFLSSFGIQASSAVLYNLRVGNYSGELLAMRIASELMLRNEISPMFKSMLFEHIALAIIIKRQEREVYGPAYTSVELINSVAQQLEIAPTEVRKLYIAMRAEFVLQSLYAASPSHLGITANIAPLDLWRETIDKLFDDHQQHLSVAPYYVRDEAIRDAISVALASRDPKSFYHIIASFEGRTLGTLVPREAEVFFEFYRQLNRQGASLTVMEQIILEATRYGNTLEDIIQIIEGLSGVNVSKQVILMYRKYLLLGHTAFD